MRNFHLVFWHRRPRWSPSNKSFRVMLKLWSLVLSPAATPESFETSIPADPDFFSRIDLDRATRLFILMPIYEMCLCSDMSLHQHFRWGRPVASRLEQSPTQVGFQQGCGFGCQIKTIASFVPSDCSFLGRPRVRRIAVPLAVITLLAIHAGLLAYSATTHSPTMNEPGHLVAGLSYWEFGRFEVYRVNPPLTRLIAALPVMAAGYEADWSSFYEGPGARPEFTLGSGFIAANGERSIWLFTIARWACIPISLIGGIFCFLWARELYGMIAGLAALVLWCFSPNILAHAELITPDAAATAFGIGAGYMFWRWLKVPTWERAACAGLLLGLAELSKMSWLFLFGLWPLLWMFWRLTSGQQGRWSWPAWRKQGVQLGAVLLGGLYLLNLGYLFDGSFTQLKDFPFVSETLAGPDNAGEGGNRFVGTWLGEVPIPVPKQYLLGLDVQKRDFEDFDPSSYLRGTWKDGGWWYYYLYGCLVKVPHGTQLLFLLACGLSIYAIRADYWRDEIILLAPAISLFVLVSSQLEFNAHFRYVLPSIGLALVLLAKPIWYFAGRVPTARWVTPLVPLALLGFSGTVVSSMTVYPHNLAYFNEGAGGSKNGWKHMLGSNFDWGQDLYFVRLWANSSNVHGRRMLLHASSYDPASIGIVQARYGEPFQLPPEDRVVVAVSKEDLLHRHLSVFRTRYGGGLVDSGSWQATILSGTPRRDITPTLVAVEITQ